jgi:hypothetical protein
MATMQIDGARQVKSGTITNTQIAAAAGIVNSKFAAFVQNQDFGGFKGTNAAICTVASDLATKGYVDSVAQGLTNKLSARAASAGSNITVTYTATGGASARGQITAAPNTIDGVTLAANDRLLLKDQTAGAQNGVYVVTTLGTGANGVWDRATDFDNESKVPLDTYIFIQEGTVNSDNGWVLTNNGVITIGGASGTALTFVQFTGAGSIIAGNGLTKTGNTLNVTPLDTSLVVATGTVGVNLAAGGTLAISSGLKVAAAGITSTEINSTSFGGGIAGGSGTAITVKWNGVEVPTGTVNGSNTAFTLANSAYSSIGTTDASAVMVMINGVTQIPTTHYTRSGTAITMVDAPLTGDSVLVFYLKN